MCSINMCMTFLAPTETDPRSLSVSVCIASSFPRSFVRYMLQPWTTLSMYWSEIFFLYQILTVCVSDALVLVQGNMKHIFIWHEVSNSRYPYYYGKQNSAQIRTICTANTNNSRPLQLDTTVHFYCAIRIPLQITGIRQMKIALHIFIVASVPLETSKEPDLHAISAGYMSVLRRSAIKERKFFCHRNGNRCYRFNGINNGRNSC